MNKQAHSMSTLSQHSRRHFLTSNTAVSPLYLSAPTVVELVQRKGLKACLTGIADFIQADFMRWEDFDKSARVANHSANGVIELMPISNESTYSFKYVNGHPRNIARGLSTVMAFGVLADVATGAPLRTAVLRGSAAAAMVVARVGCAPAMPTTAELDAFLAAHPDPSN